MWKAIVLLLAASFSGLAQTENIETKAKILAAAREGELAKAIQKQEMRHFELHRFFIPVTQGNLQWLVTQIGARPDEALVVLKMMRDWEASRERNPS